MNMTWDKSKSCKGKVRYDHRATAENAVRAMAAKGKRGLEAYRCRGVGGCRGWHIGHACSPNVIVISIEREVKPKEQG